MTTKQNEILSDSKYIPVLNHGFAGLIDSMPQQNGDAAIVQAARVSYGQGTKKISDDRGLIRYLLRHLHTTPFEMVDFKFHVKMPIFVARQWHRHRTASINEVSGRYSEMVDEFYLPDIEHIKPQSKDNKQGRDGELSIEDSNRVRENIMNMNYDSYACYSSLLNLNDENSRTGLYGDEFNGIAKELGRVVLPSSLYTEFYWKVNLHNLFHFIKLRIDPHAQYEIRVYAEAMFNLIKPIVPIASEAFEDYILYAEHFSKQEMMILKMLVSNQMNEELLNQSGLSKREINEFVKKFQ